MIGVPLTSRKSRRRRARRAAVDRADAAGRAGRLRRRSTARATRAVLAAARILGRVIAATPDPEIGAVWSDAGKLEAWLEVELAAAEALDGPTAGRPRGDPRRATFTVERSRSASGSPTTTSPPSSTCVAASVGPAGRWIHYGLTSSDVLDTALALQLREAGEIVARGRARARRTRSPSGRASTPTRCASAAPTASTPSRRRSGSSSRASPSRPTATPSGCERAFAQAAIGRALGRGRHLRDARPATRGARARAARPARASRSRPRSSPRDRHAELLSAIALAGAWLERFATEIRHLQRTEVREVEEPFRAGQKGSSAMPHKRNPITTERITRPRARAARQRAGRARERRAVARARHLALRRRAGRSCPTRRSCSTTCSTSRCGVVEGMTVHADRMRANLELTHGALFSPARAARAGRAGHGARRRLPDRPAARPAAWDKRHAAARAARAPSRALDARPRRDLRLRPLHPHVPEVLARLDVIPAADAAEPRRPSPGGRRLSRC